MSKRRGINITIFKISGTSLATMAFMISMVSNTCGNYSITKKVNSENKNSIEDSEKILEDKSEKH